MSTDTASSATAPSNDTASTVIGIEHAVSPDTVLDGDRSTPVMIVAEIALFGVTLAMALGFARLFIGTAFIPALVTTVAAAHLLTALLRRLRWNLAIVTVVQIVAAVLVLSWLHQRTTLSWGLPTGQTWEVVRSQLGDAFGPFRKLIAPVALTNGFELTLGIVIWVVAVFSDAAAFRGRAPIQAIVPHIGVVFATSVFARGEGAVVAGGMFAAAVVFHLACQRAWRASERRWVQDDRRRGPMWSIGVGALVAAVVGLLAAVVGPITPGAESSALVDLRAIGRGAGPVEVGNPLVGVSNLLGAQSDQIVFTVASPSPHYWRLTALEEFDGTDQQWKTRRRYDEAESGTRLEHERPSGVDVTSERADFELTGLGGIWLPAAFEPEIVNADIEVRHDPGSSSLIAGGRQAVPQTNYSVRSFIPSVNPDRLRSNGPLSAKVDSVYLDLPQVSPVVAATANSIVDSAGATSMYDKALALQSHFRSYRYRADVDYSASADPVAAFLEAREGFCQQFASTFAMMARSLGIPARVAVGFTYGDPDPSADGEGRFVVRGRNAHAWPELFIPGAGWLPFEPTPSRGNPDAASYTGIAAAQAEAPAVQPGVTTTTVDTEGAVAPTIPSTDEIEIREGRPDSASGAAGSDDGPLDLWPLLPWILLGAAFAYVVGRTAWTVIRRRHRRGHRDTPAHRVRAAWVESCDLVELLALRRGVGETAEEFASRVSRRCHAIDMAELARLETERLFGPDELGDQDAVVAETTVANVRTAVVDRVDRRRRWLTAIGWSRRN